MAQTKQNSSHCTGGKQPSNELTTKSARKARGGERAFLKRDGKVRSGWAHDGVLLREGEIDFRTSENKDKAHIFWPLCGRQDLEKVASTVEGEIEVTFARGEEHGLRFSR